MIRMNEAIAERLASIRTATGEKARPFAVSRQFNPSLWARIEKGTSNLPPEYLEKLIEEFNINLNWLYSGNGSRYMSKSDTEKQLIYSKPGHGVPVYDVDFAAGFGEDSFIDSNATPIAWFDIPEVENCTAIVRARGESMCDIINPGDWIGMRKVTGYRDFIAYGQIYGIETSEFGMFKYIRKSAKKDHFLLASENADYEPYELAMKHIITLWQVMVVIPLSKIRILA